MDIFKLVATLGLDSSGFSTGLVMASDMFTSFANKVIGFSRDVMSTGLGFDQAMANVTAVLGKEEGNVENMNRLRAFALDQTLDSIFTAEDAADAYYYMGMAGWKSEQMMAGLPGVMALAASSGENLGTVSDIVTDSLTAFNLTADDTQRYVDILAQTATNANTTVGLMGETFRYAASIAGRLGADVDDVAWTIGLMADAGIKGSMAGTALRNIFTRISTDAGASSEKLGAMGIITQELGVSFWDAQGKMRDWSDVIADTRVKWQGLTQEQEIAYAKQIASERGMAGWLVLMGRSEEEVRKLGIAIEDSTDAAQSMADTRMDSLAGDIDHLNSSMYNLKIAIYDDVKGPMRDVVQWATGAINEVTDAINENGLAGGIDVLGTKIEEAGEKFAPLMESIGKAAGPLISTIIDETIPKMTEVGLKLGHGLLDALGESMSESSGGLSGLAGLFISTLGSGVTIIETVAGWLESAGEQGGKSSAEAWMEGMLGIPQSELDAIEAKATEWGGDWGEASGDNFSTTFQNELNKKAFTVDINGNVSFNVPVQKNASAMATGRIFTRPMIFGYANGALQEAGDAGAEAVVGVNSLSQMINSAVGNAMSGFAAMIPADNGRDIKIVLQLDNREFGEAVYHANNEIMQRVGVRLADVRR